jgi:hypothetical protein
MSPEKIELALAETRAESFAGSGQKLASEHIQRILGQFLLGIGLALTLH